MDITITTFTKNSSVWAEVSYKSNYNELCKQVAYTPKELHIILTTIKNIYKCIFVKHEIVRL